MDFLCRWVGIKVMAFPDSSCSKFTSQGEIQGDVGLHTQLCIIDELCIAVCILS